MIKREPQVPAPAIPAELASRLLQEAAQASGSDPSTLLTQAGIPFSYADLTNGRANRLPKPYFAALVYQCISAFERQAALQGDHPPMTNDEFKMLCYCLINCPTVGQAIERAASFCYMLGGRAGRLQLTLEGDQALFTMTTFRGKPTISALFSDVVGLTSYHRLFSWLCGEYIEFSEIGTAYDAFAAGEVILELSNYPIRFQQDDNYFRFPANYLARANVRSYPELEELLQFFPFDLLSDDWLSMSLAKAIENEVRSCLLSQRDFPSIAELAVKYNLSRATLRRRLADEMTSITIIKERCRCELATELLCHSPLSLDQISNHLNYSDPRIFRRAFKQWTGLSPSQYR